MRSVPALPGLLGMKISALFLLPLFAAEIAGHPTTTGLRHLVRRDSSSSTCPAPIALVLGDCHIPQTGADPIQSYGVLIAVTDKTGSTTQLCAMPSTLIPMLAFTESNLCSAPDQIGTMTESQCLSRRGGVVSAKNFATVDVSQLPPRPGWTAFNPDFQLAINSPVLLKDTSVTSTEALITGGPNLTLSYIGLSDQSVILQKLVDTGAITSLAWSLDAGSRSLSAPRDGTLIFGGYDSSVVQGNFYTFPMNYNKTRGSRYCPLQLTVESMSWRVGSDVRTLVDPSSEVDVCIEPYDNLFRLSKNMMQTVTASFASALGPSAANTGPLAETDANILVLEPGLAYPAPSTLPDLALDINIEGGLSVTLPSFELLRPAIRGLAKNGSYASNTSFVELQVFQNTSPADAVVFGKIFLSQFVLVVDYSKNEFRLARRVTGTSPPPNLVALKECVVSHSKVTPTVIGLIVAAVVLFLLAALATFFAFKWRPKPEGLHSAIVEINNNNEYVAVSSPRS